jgi:hypothetical protein
MNIRLSQVLNKYAFHRWPSDSLDADPNKISPTAQNGEPALYSQLGSASGDTPRGANLSPTYPASFPYPAPPAARTPAKHRRTRTCDASGTRESIVGFDLGAQGRRDAGDRCGSRTGVVCHRICPHVEEEVGRLVLACRRHCALCKGCVSTASPVLHHRVRTCLAKLQPYTPALPASPTQSDLQ